MTSQSVRQQLGQYRLLHLLGQGGFARVYLAEHLRLGTHVAIKVLTSSVSGEDVKKLFAEARTIASLEHPHIVRLLDFDVEEGVPFLVMSYAAQGNLRSRFPKGSIFAPLTILPYLKQAAEALHYAHSEKFIHRDIKPENMLLSRHNELLLSDFGVAVIAHSSHSLTMQEIVGTVRYMAPEQLQGKPRPASDQYALAVIAYEWLCGHSPFSGTSTEIMGQHLHTAPPSLCEQQPTIPASLESVVLKALEKDPHQRFPDVLEFVQAFEQAVESVTTTSTVLTLRPPQTSKKQTVEELDPSSPTFAGDSPVLHKKQRRALLVGIPLLGAGLVGAGAGITLLATSHPSKKPSPATTSPSPIVYSGHSDAVRALAWSPSGKRIASAGDWFDQTVQTWDSDGGAHPFIYRNYTTTISALAWSPDGVKIACGGGNVFLGGLHSVQIWNASTGEVLFSYAGHSPEVLALAWSPDSTLIASTGQDKIVQIWDVASHRLIAVYGGHTAQVNALSWSPDGTRIVSGSLDAGAHIWDARKGTFIALLKHLSSVNTVAWSPNGKWIATGSGNPFVKDEHVARIWDVTGSEPLLAYRKHASALSSVAWSPDSKRIVSASHDKIVRVWDASSGTTLSTNGSHTLGVRAVAWSPDGKRIASAGLDGTVRVWEAPA